MKKKINAERKAYANKIAKRVARLVGFKGTAPKCNRITKWRGRAKLGGDTFSLPGWAFERHPSYLRYYIAHEALHGITGRGDGDNAFRYAEQEVAAKLGYRIVYKSHYPIRLEDKAGFTITDGQGRPY